MTKCYIVRAMRAIYIRSVRVMRFRQSAWPDSRLDEFKTSVDTRLDGLSNRVAELSGRVDETNGRIDRLQHTILIVGGGLFAAFVGVLAAIIGLIVTQL